MGKGTEVLMPTGKEWPAQPTRLGEIPKDDVEVKDQVNICATAIVSPTAVSTVSKLLQHFTSWYHLKKAVAVFMRVKVILKERSFRRANGKSVKLNEDHSLLTVKELEDAELAIIRLTQFLSLEQELGTLEQARSGQLKDQSRFNNNQVAVGKTSPIYRLDPFVDNGLLRVGGRLHNAKIPEESKHPIIFPRKSHVTTLIIRNAHEGLGHAGRGRVLTLLREKYWINGANSAVRQLIAACVVCRRNKAPPQNQKMADLPPVRLTPAPPSTYVGVDFFGPYITKEGRKERKRYGALFTCLVSRAIHIEVSNSLATDSFLNTYITSLHCLQRSCARN